MSEEKREILEHLVEYLQQKIDSGEHKIFYNDLMWDEKTIDCINAINDTLEEIERLNNIINAMLDFNFFKEECPLNFGYTEKCDEEKAQDVFYENDYCEENCNDDYKKCWLKYFERLQELKGSEKE